MARLYADEQFPVQVVYALRKLGHDIVTVRETSVDKRGDGVSDEQVLLHAMTHRQCVLTQNASDFRVLHKIHRWHAGIIACAVDRESSAKSQARRIDHEIRNRSTLRGEFVWLPREE